MCIKNQLYSHFTAQYTSIYRNWEASRLLRMCSAVSALQTLSESRQTTAATALCALVSQNSALQLFYMVYSVASRLLRICALPTLSESRRRTAATVWCCVLQCVAVCCSALQCITHYRHCLKSRQTTAATVYCSVLQYVAVCSALPTLSESCRTNAATVWCCVLQCVAVCCSALQRVTHYRHCLNRVKRLPQQRFARIWATCRPSAAALLPLVFKQIGQKRATMPWRRSVQHPPHFGTHRICSYQRRALA